MYQDKAGRKRRGGRTTTRHEVLALSPYPELTEVDIQRAAAGIL
jgi:hypothetical protein